MENRSRADSAAPSLKGIGKSLSNQEESCIWPAPTKSGHIEPSTLKKQHKKALTDSKLPPFVLYTCRHTFLTRLGASGCDVWTLAKIAGHSSIAISARYVHPSEQSVLGALEGKGGHRTGHTDQNEVVELVAKLPASAGRSVISLVGSAGLEPATSCL